MIFAKKATIGSFIFLALVAPQLASALAVMGGNGAYYNWQTSTSYWFDLSTGNSAVLPIASQPAGIYKDEGVLYNARNPETGVNSVKYLDVRTNAEKTLFSGGYLASNDPQTGDVVYRTDAGQYYKSNVADPASQTLLVSTNGGWLHSISQDFGTLVYIKAGEAYVRDVASGADVDIGSANYSCPQGMMCNPYLFRLVEGKKSVIRQVSKDYLPIEQRVGLPIEEIDFSNPQDIKITPYDLGTTGDVSFVASYQGNVFFLKNEFEGQMLANTSFFVKKPGMPEEKIADGYMLWDYAKGKITQLGRYVMISKNGSSDLLYYDIQNGTTSWLTSQYFAMGYQNIYLHPFDSLSVSDASIPADSSTPAPVAQQLVFEFSSPLDLSKIDANVSIISGNAPVAYSTTVSSDGKTLTITPVFGTWKYGTLYEVKFLSGLASSDGKTLGAEKSFSFVTESAPSDPSSVPAIASTAFPQCSSYGYYSADPLCGALNFTVAAANSSVSYGSPSDTQAMGDPVSLPTGEFTYRDAFLSLPGELPYEFSLSYRSQAYANGVAGMGWAHDYEISIRKNADGSATYSDGKLGAYTFAPGASSGSYLPVPGIKAALSEKSDGTFSLSFRDGKEYAFSADGKIAKISDRNGNPLAFAYSDGKLADVTDAYGRKARYSYRPDGRLASVSAEGRSVELSYYSDGDADGSAYDLKSVSVRQGGSEKTVSFGYSSAEGNPALSHNLSKLIDAKGQTYVENVYDQNDRVISQKYGSGTLSYGYVTGTGGQVEKNVATDRNGNVTEYVFDARGNVVKKTRKTADGDAVYAYSYDADGRVASETLPDGSGTGYRYDADGNLVETRRKADMALPDNDFSDVVAKRSYDPDTGLLVESTDPENNVTKYSYDARGNLVTVESPAPQGTAVTRLERDGAGRLTKTTDPEGRTAAYAYSADGLPVSVTRGEGAEAATETFSYDAFGNPVSVTDGEGNVRKFERDAFGKLLSETSAEGILKKYAYDANGNRTRIEIPLGNGKTFSEEAAYGILDEVLSAKAGTSADDSRGVTKTYDANGNVTAVTDPYGFRTEYAYDANGNAVEKRAVSADGSEKSVTKYSYDVLGNPVSVTDQLGNVTKYSYDAFGRVASIADPLGSVTKFAYDKLGRAVAYRTFGKDGKEVLTKTFSYDAAGNRTSETVTDPAIGKSRTSSAMYGKTGKILTATDAMGNVTKYSYDSVGRLAETADPLGNVAKLSYDRRGLVTEKRVAGTDGTETSVRSTYDKDGRKVSETDALGQTTRYGYDALGRVTRKTDAAGTATDYAYDAFGGLLSETVSGSDATSVTKWTYDKMGRKISLTDANGNVTKYSYDPLGRLASETYADGSVTKYSYDAAGRLLSKTDGNGTVVKYAYDALGRTVGREEVPGAGVVPTGNETYSYDALGRMVSAKEEGGADSSFSYDAFGSLLSEISGGKTISYSYDPLGNVTELAYPSGRKVSRTYDPLSRLAGIASGGTGLADYSRGSLSLGSVTLGNGAKTEYSYDPLMRLKSISGTVPGKGKSASEPLSSWKFSYSAVGDTLSDGRDAFGYNALSRLSSANYAPLAEKASLSEAYTYDPAGNRTSLVSMETKDAGRKAKVSSEAVSYASNQLNQYVSVGAGNKAASYSYDRNGNLLSDGTFRYAYDSRNRLREVRKADKRGALVAKYSYDPLGRRISKETGTLRTEYSYAGQDAAEERDYEKDSADWELSEVRENVYGEGVDDVVATFRTRYDDGKAGKAETLYFLKDRLGSVTAVTGADGKAVAEYRYTAFGAPYARSGKSDAWKPLGNGSAVTSRLFTGREYDPETGLYHYRARAYSPVLGRFVQRDPIGTADQVNLYAYVANNPLKWTDPTGKEKEIITRIFTDSINDFEPLANVWDPFEKKDLWTDLNFNDYDLVHFDSKSTKLGSPEDNPNITSDKLILLNGKYYSLGEVSNVLVGYNAYHAQYSLSTLNAGGMLHTYGAEATDPAASNGIVGEYFDRYLYAAGYSLADRLGTNAPTVGDVMAAIEVGTEGRYWAAQNYGATEMVDLGSLEVTSALINGMYAASRYGYDLYSKFR